MFGSVDKSNGLLFCTYGLSGTIGSRQAAMRQQIENLDGNRLLNSAPIDLAAHFSESFKIEPIQLLRDEWYAKTTEIQVDVRHDQRRYIYDTSRPVLVPGERTESRIPFEGEADIFYSRSNRMTTNPPRAAIAGNQLVLLYESPADSPQEARPLIDSELQNVETYISWQMPMIEEHNSALFGLAMHSIEQCRARPLSQSQRAAALGIPVRRRDDAPKTYAVSMTRRSAKPYLPPASSAPFTPEPTWAMEQYEQALKIMQDMAIVMERSPRAFKSMNEEALRQHFLVQLNGQLEGKVTGETFNMEGKTDMLLREGDRNVFIAECKIWKGPKVFSEAINQLLGYTTWCDGKTAILLFNRGVDTSTVLEGIETTTKQHPNFKRAVDWPHESGFRYVLSSKGDANRELILTVLVFHVPTYSSGNERRFISGHIALNE